MGTPLPVPSPLPCSQWEMWAALSGPSRILPSLLGTPELAGLDSLGAECACLVLVIGWALLWGAALSSLTMRWSCFQHLPWGGRGTPGHLIQTSPAHKGLLVPGGQVVAAVGSGVREVRAGDTGGAT